MAQSPSQRSSARRRRRTFPWAKLPREELLDVRLCDLRLSIEGTILEQRIARLHEELAHRNLLFRPYFWLSDDWFTPDRMTGTAIPFYLAHPRLIRLERGMLGEAEGSSQSCPRRHRASAAVERRCGDRGISAYRQSL